MHVHVCTSNLNKVSEIVLNKSQLIHYKIITHIYMYMCVCVHVYISTCAVAGGEVHLLTKFIALCPTSIISGYTEPTEKRRGRE